MEEATRPVQERPREECHAELGDYFNAAYVQQHAVDEAAHGLAQPCGLRGERERCERRRERREERRKREGNNHLPHLEGEDGLEAVEQPLLLPVPRGAARELVSRRESEFLEAVGIGLPRVLQHVARRVRVSRRNAGDGLRPHWHVHDRHRAIDIPDLAPGREGKVRRGAGVWEQGAPSPRSACQRRAP